MYISSVDYNKNFCKDYITSVSFGNNHFMKIAKILKQGSLTEVKNIRNLHVLGDKGESLLHVAAAIASIDIVSFLSEHINVNQVDLKGNTPVSVAVDASRLDIVKYFYSRGANLNIQDNLGRTIVMKSINDDKVFDYLLSKNVNLDLKNTFGSSIVHLVWNDKKKLSKLKEKNANLGAVDGNGQNLIHYSVDANDIDLLNFCLERGVSPNIPDYYNETPIFKTQNLQILDILKNNNVNLNQQNNNGDTCLHKAIKKNNKALINFLLDAKVDVNMINKKGETPAFYTEDEEIITKLIQAGLNIDIQNNDGEALIHKYARSGNVQLFSKIMDSTINLYVKNSAGETPKDIAKKCNHSSILDFFQVGDRGFAKVIGMNDLKDELRKAVIEPMRNREKYNKYKLGVENGILLHGLPGCGKTFIAIALAEECGRNFYQIKSSDIASPFQGVGTLSIKHVFDIARKNAPSIVFIDEIEGIAGSRDYTSQDSSSQDFTERVNELLQQMNDLAKDNIFVIGATNNPEKVDKAVKRPGRLDRKIFVGPPDMTARIGLFKKQLEGRPCEPKIDCKTLAQKTENYIAEEIKTIVNDAAKVALAEEREIKMSDLLEAIKKNKPSISKSDVEKYRKKISISDSKDVIPIDEVNSGEKGFIKVAGMKDLKDLLINDVIVPMKNPQLAAKYRIDPINGMLLYGPPGTGKTFIAKAFAEESGRYFIMMKPSDILSSLYGESTLNIRKVFEQAEYNAPAIIFIDEIEAIAPRRTHSSGGEINTQVTELLQQLNDCAKKNIFVIAATNEPQNIDDAIVRAGRFDKTVFVGPPDLEAREELFRRGLEGIPVDININYKKLAKMTEYFTAVEINQLVIKASAKEAFKNQSNITEKMLINAIENVRPKLNQDKVDFYKNKIKALF